MPSLPTRRLALPCPDCGADTFTVSVLKDEAIGTVQCLGCEHHFLLLDSEDFWFDAIQERYPRLRRCACKSTSFRLELEYAFRDDRDIRSIVLESECASCATRKRPMRVDIDYSPTDDLLSRPLRACANPKLLYDLRELNLCVKAQQMAEVARYLAEVEGCTFAGKMRRQEAWVVGPLDAGVVQALLTDARPSSTYQWICAMPHALALPIDALQYRRSEDTFARRHELIRFKFPTRFHQGGQLHYIEFANEFIEDGQVRPKSSEFRAMTARLECWLGERFVRWRGPRCYDDPQEHRRVFGDRFVTAASG